MRYHIKDIKLAERGRRRIEWAAGEMPVLRLIKDEFKKKKPLKGLKISACLHVTSETAVLMQTLKAGGATPYLCASNPLSTQDDVAASLVKHDGVSVFAICGEDNRTYYQHIRSVLNIRPRLTMDDGADLITTVHRSPITDHRNIVGGTEETTTGVIRLKSMADRGILRHPIISVNDAQTKHFFDNRYGTGQSTIDGILRATNRLLAGSNFVVCGYGWCGRGIAMRARGMGARVIVTEVDPLKALEASMDGYQVMPLNEAARVGDIFVTASGDINLIDKRHFRVMRDGAIVANAGHFNVEINIPALKKMARRKKRIRGAIDQYLLPGGKRINLLGEGRLVNLACAEGHPPTVMDMSFANQALSVEYLIKKKDLKKKVYPVPSPIDRRIARLKLKSLGIRIDRLTKEQEKYLKSWELGT
ncbi:MAG TPA: adenosylhomocysteinase [bacterium]|nr:adenosylhomocysteinase [bacterium]